MGMPALSVRQPWAWLIVNGHKDIENRDWYTKFRGRILVHAGKGMTRSEYSDVADATWMTIKIPSFADLERGGIVGAVDIVDCVRASNSRWFFGGWGFVLANAATCQFIPYKGQLGIFSVPQDTVHRAKKGEL